MSLFVIIDTDILIDVGRGKSEAIDCLLEIEKHSSLALSLVTEMELLLGCRNKEEIRATDKFLKRFQIKRIDEVMCDMAVGLLRKYRLSHGLLIADALIAATAMRLDVELATKNQRDYRFIEGLKLLPYPIPFSQEKETTE